MSERFEHLNIYVENTRFGDWAAEAITMDDLGVNIVNYNLDKEQAVVWLVRGLEDLGFAVSSYDVHEVSDDKSATFTWGEEEA